MAQILISINPQHVKKIIDGSKVFEFRRRVAKQNITSMLVYETAPVARVVAEVEVKGVLCAEPNDLWVQTKNGAGIDKIFFDEYFAGRSVAYAYSLGKVTLFEQPKALSDFGVKAAPQSYIYIK